MPWKIKSLIKVVPDANVIIRGLIGGHEGYCRQILNLALAKKILMFGSCETFSEFCEKLDKKGIEKRLAQKNFSKEKAILDYKSFIQQIEPFDTLRGVSITRDKDDDIYFKAAKMAGVKIIITQDEDLLVLKKYDGILAVTPTNFLKSTGSI